MGCEALWKANPEVFIDSMGYPFTLPLFRWIAGSKVACYVHYPTITSGKLNHDCRIDLSTSLELGSHQGPTTPNLHMCFINREI